MIDHDRLFKELLTTFFVEFIELFSYDTPVREEPRAHHVAFPDLAVLDFTYRVIQLNRLNWRDFVRRPNPVASALMAKMGIVAVDRPKVKLECLRLLATLRLDPAKSHFISSFIDTYLRLSATEIRAFQAELEAIAPREKEGVMQLTTSWKEEGIQEGFQQGLAEGLQRGKADLVVRLLTRRLGTLDSAMEARVRALDAERLEDLGEALLDFTAPADVIAWLEQHEPDQPS